MYTKRIKLGITPGEDPKVINVSQYDAGSRTIELELFTEENTEMTIPSSATAVVNGTKPDGNAFSYDATLSEGVATVVITEQMAAVAGKVPCKLVISSGSEKLLTEKFILEVDRAAMDKDTVSSDSDLREFAEIMEDPSVVVEAANRVTGTKEAAEAAAAAAIGAKESVDAAENRVKAVKDEIEDIKGQIEEDKTDIDDALQDLDESKTGALRSILEAKENAVGVVDDKAQDVVRIKSNAETVAAQALSKANNTSNQLEDVLASNDQLKKAVTSMQLLLNQKVDDGYADAQGYLHLTANGNDVGSRIGPFAGGSGGGGGASSGNNAVFTARNATGWISTTIAEGDACNITFEWSSVEEELPTGKGRLTIYVGGAIKTSREVDQGMPVVNIAEYLSVGTNLVTFNIADIYGNNKTFNVSVDVEVLTISSQFDAGMQYDGPILFTCMPFGAISKTIYLYLDNSLLDSLVTSASGRELSFTIPQQPHGVHGLRCYFECTINGKTVKSNELYYEIICTDPLDNTPIIASNFTRTAAVQYETLNIAWSVYTPSSMTSDVSLLVDNDAVNTLTVDRTQQTWSVRMDTPGNHILKIKSGAAEKTFTVAVTESEIHVEAETDQMALCLTAQGRSNNENDPGIWTYGSGANAIEAEMSGFNFVSDGWQLDEDGFTCLRISGNARVQIPYKPFETDARRNGLTIEIEYATRNVADYNTVVLSCMSGDRGLTITPQSAVLRSEQTELSMQYKDGEHIRIAYTIDKRSENRLLRSFIDGKPARVAQYPNDDDFSQVSPAGISIGSNECTIDIYYIRVYTKNLTYHQILDNWIADTPDAGLMLERYNRNQVYDEYGNVIISRLPSDLPYMIIDADELPQFKGDKKTVAGSYTDPMNPSRSFTFTRCEMDRQGTSSSPYYRPNLDMKFKGGFEMITSGHADTFKLRDNSVPTARFVGKANVASSEMANNTELVRLYNDACPYKTPEMVADSRVRWGIDGYPIVIFWHDTVTDTTKFYGNYDFNFPKRFAEGYGYTA